MSQSGEEVLKAIRGIRRLHEDVSLLLYTAEKLMERRDWQGFGSVATVNSSAKVDAPRQWMPQDAFRFFKHSQRPGILGFVAVILDDIENEETVREPLVSAGWHCFEKGEELSRADFEWIYARWHIFMPERKDDGSLVSADPRQLWPRYKYRIEKTTTFAVPLVEVRSEDDLRTKVVEPLLKAIEEAGT